MSVLAKLVPSNDLPFQVNWSGPDVKAMVVDDKTCLTSMVNFVGAIDNLQPNIEDKLKLRIRG